MVNHDSEAPRFPEPGRVVLSVLVVDDQRFVTMAIRRLLAAEQDIEVHSCDVAADAVAHANRLAPNVILQDLVMPGIDGFTLVGLYRGNPTTALTPIIVLSGNDDASAQSRAIAAGASDYLVKLPDQATLISCIRRHANSQPKIDASGSSAPAAGDAALPTLDRAMIAELIEASSPDGAEIVVGVIDEFLLEAASLVGALTAAAQRTDAGPLKSAAHSLRGMSMTLGARRLGALAGQVEEHAQREPAVTLDSALTIAISEELARVHDECLLTRQALCGSGSAAL